ncbi:MAG TPA: glutathione binding-like protein [Chroococcales cyanobacterium]
MQERNWLECDRATITDVACFPYIALAPEGKISLESYPHVMSWMERIKQRPSYIVIPGL